MACIIIHVSHDQCLYLSLSLVLIMYVRLLMQALDPSTAMSTVNLDENLKKRNITMEAFGMHALALLREPAFLLLHPSGMQISIQPLPSLADVGGVTGDVLGTSPLGITRQGSVNLTSPTPVRLV